MRHTEWTPLAGATKLCDYAAVFEGIEIACKGRVYFFPDAVRLRCPFWDVRAEHNGYKCECGECSGGWVANTDGWVWWQAARNMDRLDKLTMLIQAWWADWMELGDPEAALVAALERAVAASGGTLWRVTDAVLGDGPYGARSFQQPSE